MFMIGRKSIVKSINVDGVRLMFHLSKNGSIYDMVIPESYIGIKSTMLNILRGRQWDSLVTRERIINVFKELKDE